MRHSNFLADLKRREGMLKGLKAREVAIFNVSGRYGFYQVKVGPEDMRHHRPIEINGRVHHLFVNGRGVEAMPTKEEIDRNMKGTIIMNDVTVRLFDKNGDGHKVMMEHIETDGAHARESINLAGEDGEKMLSELEASGRLANETYHIVQEDILKSLDM